MIHIYWEEDCRDMIYPAKDIIEQTFRELSVVFEYGVSIYDSFDSSRIQYDAPELLNKLPEENIEHNDISLLLVKKDIFAPGFSYLYGAAMKGRAVVSGFRPCSQQDLDKEIIHELGHAIGLRHCTRDCVMNTSKSERKLQKKTINFCPLCQEKLSREFR